MVSSVSSYFHWIVVFQYRFPLLVDASTGVTMYESGKLYGSFGLKEIWVDFAH
jgi:hypothetical protein